MLTPSCCPGESSTTKNCFLFYLKHPQGWRGQNKTSNFHCHCYVRALSPHTPAMNCQLENKNCCQGPEVLKGCIIGNQKKPTQLTVAVHCQSKWVLFEAKLLTLLQTSSRSVHRNQQVNSFLVPLTAPAEGPHPCRANLWFDQSCCFTSSPVTFLSLHLTKGKSHFCHKYWEMQSVLCMCSASPGSRGVPKPPGGWILSPEKSHFSYLTQEKELLWALFTAACCDHSIAWSIISLEEAPEGIDSGLSSWKFVLPAGNSMARGWHFFSLPTQGFVTWGNCAEQVYVIPPLKGWVKMSSPVINIDIKTISFPAIVTFYPHFT